VRCLSEERGRGREPTPAQATSDQLADNGGRAETKSKTKVGCFHRPKLPKEAKIITEEVRRESAVRDDLVISGHKDFNSLYAANDEIQEKFTVNILGAPNNSTTTCGCDNINCPFCNLVKSISNRDPSLY